MQSVFTFESIRALHTWVISFSTQSLVARKSCALNYLHHIRMCASREETTVGLLKINVMESDT